MAKDPSCWEDVNQAHDEGGLTLTGYKKPQRPRTLLLMGPWQQLPPWLWEKTVVQPSQPQSPTSRCAHPLTHSPECDNEKGVTGSIRHAQQRSQHLSSRLTYTDHHPAPVTEGTDGHPVSSHAEEGWWISLTPTHPASWARSRCKRLIPRQST